MLDSSDNLPTSSRPAKPWSRRSTAANSPASAPWPRTLAWLLGHSPATLLIPGTRDLGHLADNVTVARVELDQEAMTALDPLAQDVPA